MRTITFKKILESVSALLFGIALLQSGDARALFFGGAYCRVHLGQGCSGPKAYDIQLCSKSSVNKAKCVNLCDSMKPICNVTDFEPWVNAFNAKGFLSSRLGKGTVGGDLSQDVNVADIDSNGQLVFTSGKLYTVCKEVFTTFFPVIGLPITTYAKEKPVASGTCGFVNIPNATNCTGGTRFNGDPTNPKCVTQNSYCAGGGGTGNYVSTMGAGFQMVAVQNQHFVNAPGEDPNLHNLAATAGTFLTGMVTPTPEGLSGDVHSKTAQSSSATSPSAASGSGAGTGSSASASTVATGDQNAATANDSAFASKTFGMENSGYTKGSGGGAGGSGGSGGASWFGSGGGSGVTAGTTSGDVGFDGKGGEGGASRGLASDGTLNVEDPANYFLMSDVSVSLFKRVTAQFRKKERSLFITQIERPTNHDAK
jgi:hypothetical protein